MTALMRANGDCWLALACWQASARFQGNADVFGWWVPRWIARRRHKRLLPCRARHRDVLHSSAVANATVSCLQGIPYCLCRPIYSFSVNHYFSCAQALTWELANLVSRM